MKNKSNFNRNNTPISLFSMKHFTIKNILIASVLILSIVSSSHAQVDLQFGNIDAIMMNQGASKVFRNSKNNGNKIQGTPYLQQMFAIAKVENVNQKYFMRYNAFADEFEFITPKNDTLVLDKIKDFSNITFTGINKKYTLVDYVNIGGKSVKGYLIDYYSKGNCTLYVQERVLFYDGKIAKTSLEKEMPARYVKSDNAYYFKCNDQGIIEFPENKKQLLKLFPTKKQEIEVFLKESKVSFNEDYDKVKIIDFLSTL